MEPTTRTEFVERLVGEADITTHIPQRGQVQHIRMGLDPRGPCCNCGRLTTVRENDEPLCLACMARGGPS